MRFMIVALSVALVAAVAYANCDEDQCGNICTNFCKFFGQECGSHECKGDKCKITCANGLQNAIVSVDGTDDCDKEYCGSMCTDFCKIFGRECLKTGCIGENCQFSCTEGSKDVIGGFKNVTVAMDGKTYNFKH